jgi:hypothetical protein
MVDALVFAAEGVLEFVLAFGLWWLRPWAWPLGVVLGPFRASPPGPNPVMAQCGSALRARPSKSRSRVSMRSAVPLTDEERADFVRRS